MTVPDYEARPPKEIEEVARRLWNHDAQAEWDDCVNASEEADDWLRAVTAALADYDASRAELVLERDRLRAALAAIEEKYRRSSDAWRPDRDTTKYATDWHDGFHTALASMSLLAGRALDPENYERSDEMQRVASYGTDREWFDLTGCCGHCGSSDHDCVCTDDDPCGCGPHEPRTWPIPCYACLGSGVQEPRKPKVRVEVPSLVPLLEKPQ